MPLGTAFGIEVWDSRLEKGLDREKALDRLIRYAACCHSKRHKDGVIQNRYYHRRDAILVSLLLLGFATSEIEHAWYRQTGEMLKGKRFVDVELIPSTLP